MEESASKKIIGTCWLTNDSRRLYLHHLGIHPSFQQKGYGELLSRRALEYSKNLNLQVKLEVHKKNTAAIKLYRKLGFKYLGDYLVLIKRKH